MRLLTSSPRKLSSRQVSVAAEAFAASQFARCGFDVLQQAGHSRSSYDLGVATSNGMMKVSVNGTLNGFWNLVDRFLGRSTPVDVNEVNHHRAIELWLEHHRSRITCCMVAFDAEDLNRMPRIYLASAQEVAEKLHENADLLGDAAMYEEYEFSHATGVVNTVQTLPASWKFSEERIAALMDAQTNPVQFRFSHAVHAEASSVLSLPMMN